MVAAALLPSPAAIGISLDTRTRRPDHRPAELLAGQPDRRFRSGFRRSAAVR